MRLTLQGEEKLQAFLKSRPTVATKALAGALHTEAQTIREQSMRIVPVDVGTLRGSAHVTEPETKGTTVSVDIGYGGAASAYALVQHERTDYAHSGNQQAKYLEQPALEAAHGMGQRIAAAMGRRLEKH